MMGILSAAVAPNSLGSLPGPSGHKRGTGEIKPSRGGNLSADEGSLVVGRTTKRRLMTRVTAAACSM